MALLDDGVDPEEDELGKFVSGRGFPKPSEAVDGSTQPESFQTAGPLKHGNRMAKLITIACPFVRLYVAKINAKVSVEANHHPSFDVSRAVEVGPIVPPLDPLLLTDMKCLPGHSVGNPRECRGNIHELECFASGKQSGNA